MEDRVIVMEHDPTDAEIWALIYKIAEQRKPTEEHVAIVTSFSTCGRAPSKADDPAVLRQGDSDLRVLEGGRQQEALAGSASLGCGPTCGRTPPRVSLAEHTADMMEQATGCLGGGATMPERIQVFMERTGKSRATAYRYWRELGFVAR